METKQFNFGDTRKATVLHTERIRGRLVIICVDELNEGHVCFGHPETKAKKGDKGVLTFSPGGSKGGFWKFSKTEGK